MRLLTYITLPPGGISKKNFKLFLTLILYDYEWVRPHKYGHIFPDKKLKNLSKEEIFSLLIKEFDKNGDLELQESRSRNWMSIIPNRFETKSFTGYIIWETKVIDSRVERKNHSKSVAKIMDTLNSPLSFSCDTETHDFYCKRMTKSLFGEELTFTVKDYAHGLENTYWRMWFGMEYRDFFGIEKLRNSPIEFTKEYKTVFFIQIYKEVEDWDDPIVLQEISSFKKYLGKDSFYNPEEPDNKLKAPDFSHLL